MSVSTIYLDANATTPPLPEVVEEVARVMREAFGNPGSRHAAGRKARQALEGARERIAAILGAKPRELIFTSGGTESINMALRGLARGEAPGVAALPPGEHPATEESIRRLEAAGWERSTIPIDADGQIRHDELERLPWRRIRFATALLAHNETGVVQNLTPLAQECHEQGVPLHVDAVQAVGKLEVSFQQLNAAALSFAAHKFYGPRGIGGLLVREGLTMPSLLQGGHQEQDRRPGTECTALAAGMATALEVWHRDRTATTERLTILRDRLQQGLLAACPEAKVIGAESPRLPNTLSIGFPGCDGEALLVALDLAGVCCSMGSTCASGSAEIAPILKAMAVSPEIARSCLRFSVGIGNTEAEIDQAVAKIAAVAIRQRGPSPLAAAVGR